MTGGTHDQPQRLLPRQDQGEAQRDHRAASAADGETQCHEQSGQCRQQHGGTQTVHLAFAPRTANVGHRHLFFNQTKDAKEFSQNVALEFN